MKGRTDHTRAALPIALLSWILAAACGNWDNVEDIRLLQVTGRHQESIERLKPLLESQPGDPELLYLYGTALHATGHGDLALWALFRASESPDWSLKAFLALARSSFSIGSWGTAIEASSQALALEPDNTEALVIRGEARVRQKKSPELALQDFDRAYELSPESSGLRVSRALALIQLERLEEAGEIFEELAAEKLSGDNEDSGEAARYCTVLATFTKERGDTEAASPLFDRCLEEFPTNQTVVQQALQYFDGQKDWERSIEILENALLLAPNNSNYRDTLVDRLAGTGKQKEAERVLREGTGLDNRQAASHAWQMLSRFHHLHDESAEAADAFGRSLELQDRVGNEQWLIYAEMLALAGRHEEALEVASGLPDPIYADIVQARTLYMQDRAREALERLETVLLRWPNNAGARYHAARAAEQVGDFDRAIEEYRQAIRAGPKDTDAGLRLARLYEAQGNFEAALFAINECLVDFGVNAEGIEAAIRIASSAGNRRALTKLFEEAIMGQLWSEAVISRATWLATHQRPELAVQMIRASDVELTDPGQAGVLRTLVVQLAADGKGETGLAEVARALSAHPDAADLHEVHGTALAASADAKAAYERALELEPEHAAALAGLARLAAARGDTQEAVELYDRAIRAGAGETDTIRAAATLLAESGRIYDATEYLDDLLKEHPYESEAALQLAELYIEREPPETERARQYARQALRFGAGARAREFLERLDATQSPPNS